MVQQASPSFDEIVSLFANADPDRVWDKALEIAKRIKPEYAHSLAKTVFDDAMLVFRGEYPGYGSVKTPYHNRSHTLDVFLCAIRLMHGAQVQGEHFSDDEITLVMIASLLHDIGYAPRLEEETEGSGAQFTRTHVRRGIEFMHRYCSGKNQFPAGFPAHLEPILLSTDHTLPFSSINFPNERSRLLGKIVSTADLTGQMADRTYLEKLLFLYLEFKEAHLGNFNTVHELLQQTGKFYEITRKKLDEELDSTYNQLSAHFKDTMGVEKNYYLESIEKNIAYLSKVIRLDEEERLSMLKRGGIVGKIQA